MANEAQGWDLNQPTVAPQAAGQAQATKTVYVPVKAGPRITAANVIGLILFGFVLLSWLVPVIGIFAPILLGLLLLLAIIEMRKHASKSPIMVTSQGTATVKRNPVVLALKVIAFIGIAVALFPFIMFGIFMLLVSTGQVRGS